MSCHRDVRISIEMKLQQLVWEDEFQEAIRCSTQLKMQMLGSLLNSTQL
jgi:hypothetical protein